MHATSSIVISELSFGFDPLDDPLLEGLNATIPPGRTGIVGHNGTGKTTLLRLISGELTPTSGQVLLPGPVAHVRQDLFQRPGLTVAELLGIGNIRAAIRAIESGSIDQADFDNVGNEWDVEARAVALLGRRLPSLAGDDILDRTAGTLSGGELMGTAMCGLELSESPIAVLDEPTNNLDARSRRTLNAAVEDWSGTLVVVSHDVALLNQMDNILEIHGGELRVFGGNYDHYRSQLAQTEVAAERTVRAAEQKERVERRERDHVQTAMARRARNNAKAFRTVKGGPRMGDPTAKRAAEARRAGEVRKAAGKVREAREELERAEDVLRDNAAIRIQIVDSGIASGRRLAELVGTNRTVHVTGGLRLALVGDNGVGKTSLLRTLLHPDESSHLPACGRLLTDRVGYLDQRLALADDKSVLDLLRSAAPGRPPEEIHGGLARFLIRGDMIDQPVGSLSGGERFRVAFARLLLADPPPELLILDEPTNNLDLASIEQLVDGLRSYRGALVVVSHDQHLLEQLDLDEVVELDTDGRLTVL